MDNNEIKKIYNSINELIKDDTYHQKLTYSEADFENSGQDFKAINEHILHNRYKKIIVFKALYENWDTFSQTYKNDPIMAKIGAELLTDKMEFNSEIINNIKQYPQSKNVLYYFKKNQELELPVNGNEYNQYKEKLLKDTQDLGQQLIENKKTALKAINTLEDNNRYQLTELMGEACLDNTLNKEKGRIKSDSLLKDIKQQINEGNLNFYRPKTALSELSYIKLPIKSETKSKGISTEQSFITLTLEKNNNHYILRNVDPGEPGIHNSVINKPNNSFHIEKTAELSIYLNKENMKKIRNDSISNNTKPTNLKIN